MVHACLNLVAAHDIEPSLCRIHIEERLRPERRVQRQSHFAIPPLILVTQLIGISSKTFVAPHNEMDSVVLASLSADGSTRTEGCIQVWEYASGIVRSFGLALG